MGKVNCRGYIFKQMRGNLEYMGEDLVLGRIRYILIYVIEGKVNYMQVLDIEQVRYVEDRINLIFLFQCYYFIFFILYGEF